MVGAVSAQATSPLGFYTAAMLSHPAGLLVAADTYGTSMRRSEIAQFSGVAQQFAQSLSSHGIEIPMKRLTGLLETYAKYINLSALNNLVMPRKTFYSDALLNIAQLFLNVPTEAYADAVVEVMEKAAIDVVIPSRTARRMREILNPSTYLFSLGVKIPISRWAGVSRIDRYRLLGARYLMLGDAPKAEEAFKHEGLCLMAEGNMRYARAVKSAECEDWRGALINSDVARGYYGAAKNAFNRARAGRNESAALHGIAVAKTLSSRVSPLINRQSGTAERVTFGAMLAEVREGLVPELPRDADDTSFPPWRDE